jgi:hypothetical protein
MERKGVRLTTTRHDLCHLFLPIIVQHFVSLIDDGVSNAGKRQDVGLRHKVEETTGSSNEDVAAFHQLILLFANWCTTVGDAGAKHGSIAQTASLIEDLAAKLAGRGNDQDKRFAANGVMLRVEAVGEVGTRSGKFLGLTH